ncbi:MULTISPECIES: MerR family transcriptional regulator [unclassified Streptomyces]|uniref:MerR family transcriptional regulator n=1 Tax=unclassified Streptomyces TaxID=2593676 RepID=UPI0027E4052E|nr:MULTISPECIES: MerR family transcriptional regulator [unclassified Streptomyces]MCH0567565.1 MerR family transcriptional regulator [Streptomyces sp. MUM 2J]MCH0572140.1 MerR family transcriptional regulator [Streptomyces sp. MUM 136J]
MRELGIGDLARQARIRPSALRYYESIGLLPSARRVGGRRVYPASTVRRIALIKMAQRAKFTLAEIGQLLDSAPDRVATRQWRALAERKIPELDQFIQETQALRNAVADCLACGCMNFDSCQLLSSGPAGDDI